MTRWLFDLGNTRLKCAPLDANGRPGESFAISHRDTDIASAMAQLLPAHIEVAYLASVASPEVRASVLEALCRQCRRISLARTQSRFGGVSVAYVQPEKLGVDRFLALLAVHARSAGDALVVGVGTAMTIDLIARGGRHIGGRIAPSPTLMRQSLHARVPQLPLAGGEYRPFADDTADALASGCSGAAIGLIQASVDAARSALGRTPALYLHGGGGEPLLPMLDDARWCPALVLEGLAVWASPESPPDDPGTGMLATIGGC